MANTPFKFRKLDSVGSPEASQDMDFLIDCFVDTGLLEVLLDCQDPRRILVGRTGSGKTALLQKAQDAGGHVRILPPEHLAVEYIANSTILQFVLSLGVKLDLFFRLLWRHALIVEFFKMHTAISETSTSGFLEMLRNLCDSRKRQNLKRVVDYMEHYSDQFWQETDRRIKDVTSKVEQDIRASIETGGDWSPLQIGLEGGKSLTTEQREEISHRAQSVVNKIQMRELSEMMDLLDEVLDDPQQRFYVVIDRLDEDWVDDRLRYGLIRALLETVRDFHKVKHAKVVVALRLDLIDRVFSQTRDAGFQEEKYEGELLRLAWSRAELNEILDKRVNHLVRKRYAKHETVHAKDVLPRKIGDRAGVDYLIDHTLLRPRDVIHFFNTCIQHSAGQPVVTAKSLRAAEGEYSRTRLRALADEWYADYPNLLGCVKVMLTNRPVSFLLGDIESAEISDQCLSAITSRLYSANDRIATAALDVAEGRLHPQEFLLQAVEMFYRVGILGLKLDPTQPAMWSIDGRRTISTSEIQRDTRVSVHQCFWRVLGIGERPSH